MSLYNYVKNNLINSKIDIFTEQHLLQTRPLII